MNLGSPAKGSPSGVYTSQISRHTASVWGLHGRTAYVDGSGLRYMSLSKILVNPSMDEPSNHVPFESDSSTFSTGMVTDFNVPNKSENCSLTNLMLSFFIFSSSTGCSISMPPVIMFHKM